MTPTKDPTASFLEDLAGAGAEPILAHTSGTIRIDLDDSDETVHWYVVIDQGAVKVSHRAGKADAVVRCQKQLFDGMCRGTVNANAAMLRGVLGVEGDLGLVGNLSRLMPGPPKSRTSYLERQKEAAR
jgi:putative sterol carrier protein